MKLGISLYLRILWKIIVHFEYRCKVHALNILCCLCFSQLLLIIICIFFLFHTPLFQVTFLLKNVTNLRSAIYLLFCLLHRRKAHHPNPVSLRLPRLCFPTYLEERGSHLSFSVTLLKMKLLMGLFQDSLGSKIKYDPKV